MEPLSRFRLLAIAAATALMFAACVEEEVLDDAAATDPGAAESPAPSDGGAPGTGPVAPDPVDTDPVDDDPIDTDPVDDDPAEPEPTTPEPDPEPVTPADPCAGVGEPGRITATQPFTQAEKCAMLKAHNDARAEVGVPPLEWSDAAESVAYAYARNRASQGCIGGHNANRGNYGENLWRGWSSAPGQFTVTGSTIAWIDDEKGRYNYASNTCIGGECLHYTQVVWRNTTAVGCGYATCDESRSVVIVCNYTPPGNVNINTTRPY